MARRRSAATRSSPRLWTACKAEACTRGKLCKHSARKMQWAVRCYTSKGGRYAGPKRSSNSLVRWGKQKWKTHDGSPSGGRKRYLPAEAWKHMSPDQIRRTNAAKLAGHQKGKQFVRQPTDVARLAKRFREPLA